MENSGLKKKKINEVRVTKLRIGGGKKKFRGDKIFNDQFPNVFICGKKKSGKSYAVYSILKNIITKKADVIIIANTVARDPVYKKMRKNLEKAGINVRIETNLIGPEGNLLEEIADELDGKRGGEDEEEEYYSDDSSESLDDSELIIIYDDLGTELNNKTVSNWLKKHRHYRCTNIISSQYWNDINKQGRCQLDLLILFPDLPEDKLKDIHKDTNLSIPLEKFLELYRDATAEKYNFLYVDVRIEEFRKNFSEKYVMD